MLGDVHGVRLDRLQLTAHEHPSHCGAQKPPNGIITCGPEARSGQTCRQTVRTHYLRLPAETRMPQFLQMRA